MMKMRHTLLALSAALALFSHAGLAKVKIGMAIDDLRLERWQKDRDILSAGGKVWGQSICPVGQRQ